MPKTSFSWLSIAPKDPSRRFVAAVLTTALFLSLVVAISTLARQAVVQMRALNTANSDNLQWTLSQTEVEYLQYYNTVVEAAANPNADLAPLRRWFDVFYSRINVLMRGPVYRQLAKQPQMVSEFTHINTYLGSVLPYIDGPDAPLRARLVQLVPKTAALRADVRSISLEGIRVFSKLSDMQRVSASETIGRIALLTVGLILLLLLAVFFLARIYGITRRQAIENQSTRERLQAMLNTSLDAVLVVNRQGRFVEFNGAATEIFGYSEAEAVGADMTQLIFPDHMIDAHNIGMRRHLETGEQRIIGKGRVQFMAKRKSGSVFPVELSVAKTMSPDGEIFVSYLRDISERISAEQRLTKARDEALAGERAKARFLAVMSHEMRTPLNGLLGSLDLLKTTRLSPKQAEFAEVMQKSGALLLHHVNDVLDISRLESGRINGKHVVLDLDALIQDVLESQSALAQAKGLTLRYRPETTRIGTIMGSAIGLRQVLLNLVSNAIKFTQNGLVEVQASVIDAGAGEGGDPHISLRVRDTGIGIAPGSQALIFEDFVTLDSSFGRRADGTGLGLGIARRIVQSMGGEIGVVSQPKLGATFWITFPYRRVVQTQEAQDPTPPLAAKTFAAKRIRSGGRRLDILVVEDNQINRFILREMLRAVGHRVTEAVDGLEGVQLAQNRRFDMIFMDISMPMLDGIAATVRLRAGTGPSANAPIVALTAHALPDDRALFLASGMNAVLTKPLDRAMLETVLAEFAGTPKTGPKTGTAPSREQKPDGAKIPQRQPNLAAPDQPDTRPQQDGDHPHFGFTQTQRQGDADARDIAAAQRPLLPVLRTQTLDDMKIALGDARFTNVIAQFLQEGDDTVLQSEGAISTGELATAQGMLHSMAGAAAMFGAAALQAHLAQMETDLKAHNGTSAHASLPDLRLLWASTRSEITKFTQV